VDGAGIEVVGHDGKVVAEEVDDLRGGQWVGGADQDERRLARFAQGEERAEVGVVRNDNPIVGQCSIEDRVVVGVLKADLTDGDGVMTGQPQTVSDIGRQVRIDEEPHAGRVSGSSRSCTAAAAYSSAAMMSSNSRSGNSATTSAAERPAASWPITVATGIRSPRMHGTPRICAGLIVIRSYSTPLSLRPPVTWRCATCCFGGPW
jgi:hypothetical protein